ncbi:MFS transporter [Sporosarcina sp. ACRSL]|uniref:MFS transporter n=1 Tax=Sporosarcina sp. ACRSL TaxID=2918215 RepID=UPI001EF71BC5|nr:MFS transporter [Sporosarcina sp. ACRSL]MCG7345227.1 MFS transporter [Sporosarcina sp. ACRSL]
MSQRISKQNATLLIITIFAVSVNMRPAITSIGPMLDIIRHDLSLTNAQVSLLTALPVFCMGLFASLSPYLNRKLGLTRSMYLMLILIGFMTMLRGFYANYTSLLISAIIIGIAIAVMGPLLSAMIKQSFPERSTSVIGVYSFGMGVGSSLGAGLTAILFESTGSYPFALGIWAVLAVAGIILWMISVKGDMRVQQEGSDIIDKRKADTVSPWRKKKAWLYLLFFGFQAASFFCVITWIVPVVTDAGMSLVQASMLLSLMMTLQIVLNLIFPLLYERFPRRRFWLLLFLIMGLIGFSMLWTGESTLMWASSVLLAIPLAGLFPISLLFPLDATETPEDTNAWTAMMQTGGYLMAGFLPLVIALIYDWTGDHHYTLLIFMGLFVAMIVLTFMIGERETQE